MEVLTFTLFLTRSSMDRVFDTMRVHVAGMEMTAGAFLNLGILGLAALLTLRRAGSVSFPLRIWMPFILVAGASIAWSSDKAGGVRAFLVLLTYVSFLAAPFLVRASFRHSGYLLKAIAYSSAIPVSVGLVELALSVGSGSRLQSTFIHPNAFAFYLMVVLGVIFFLLSSAAVQFTPFVRQLIIPYSGLLLLLLIFTQTRSAWAGTFLILATYAIFINRRYLLFLPLLPLLLFIPAVGDRLSNLEQGTAYTGAMGSKADEINSFAWRELLWESAFADAAGSPVLGKGLASFAPNALNFFPLADANKEYYRGGIGAHSVFVQIYYETGAAGLFCYLLIYLGLFSRVVRNFKLDPRGATMLGSIILAYMAANFSDNVLDYGSVNIYFWGFTGVVLAKWAQQRPARAAASRSRLTVPSRLAYRPGVGELRPSA